MKTASKLKQLAKKLRAYKKIEVPRGHFPVDIVDVGALDGVGPTTVVRYPVSLEFLKCEFFKRLLHEYDVDLVTRGPIMLPCSIRKFEEALYRDRLHSRISKN